jgi:hypothetical protein
MPTERSLATAAVIFAALPFVYHGVRAAADRWVPSGDDAYFTLRSLDVATPNHPLLGAWSSGSANFDRQVNNLGPMQLDLLAPFTRVNWAGGTAIGVVTVHLAAIFAIAWLSFRLGGHRQVVASMLGVTLLAWVMGSEMMITPQQHQYLLFPYLCLLVATWAAASGDRWAPLVWVIAASLVTQTHLSYPILVVALAIPLLAGQALAWREKSTQRRELVGAWLVSVVVGFVLWLQTIVDQFFGWGNLTAAIAAGGGESSGPGLETGARLVGHVLASPTGYVRGGFAGSTPAIPIGSDAQFVLLGLSWVLIAAGAAVAHHHGRIVAAAGMATLTAAVAGAVINASRLPLVFGVFGVANYRWLWPTAALLLVGVASLAVRVHKRAPTIVLTMVGALAVANLPFAYEVVGPDNYRMDQTAVAEITEQLFRELPQRNLVGPVVVDERAMPWGHRLGYPLGIVLRKLDFDYRFEGPHQARRFGESRVADGTEPTRLVLHHGDDAVKRFGSPNTVAYMGGPRPASVTLERTVTP